MSETPTFTPRTAGLTRTTRETDITVDLTVDGTGTAQNDTGVGFLDHMLDLFAKHGRFDLTITCDGDLEVDAHHTVEDVGIVLGQAFTKALGDKSYIARYGHAYVPMDETLARSVVDLSGRFYLHCNSSFSASCLGELPTEMIEHFWYSFAEQLRCNLHIDILHGSNNHHKAEAMFKSAARALDIATARSSARSRVLSTKGQLG